MWWQLSKDIYDENEDVSYSWIREYHWDVCRNILKIQRIYHKITSWFRFKFSISNFKLLTLLMLKYIFFLTLFWHFCNILIGSGWWCRWSHNILSCIRWVRSTLLGISWGQYLSFSTYGLEHSFVVTQCQCVNLLVNSICSLFQLNLF